LNRSSGSEPDTVSPLLESIRATLEAAGRLNSVAGQLALSLTRAMESPIQTGSSVAALSKELRVVMAHVMRDAPAVADPLDELARRRERKLMGSPSPTG
jgi:hypothetical protein